ncbi:MAG: Nramp family divalent metal transporter, partial [Deltaproteobacteria bacterium]|nr:Nramp family divalent metal transporter [Deltaproteobacteria bacterium]
YVFLLMGWGILFTSQIGVMDLFSRLSTDIIKTSFFWVRKREAWTESRIYFVLVIFLALFAIFIFAAFPKAEPFLLLTIGAALNGIVMFVYSILLLYMNRAKFPKEVRMGPVRTAIMVWAVLFFGVFSFLTIKSTFINLFG